MKEGVGLNCCGRVLRISAVVLSVMSGDVDSSATFWLRGLRIRNTASTRCRESSTENYQPPEKEQKPKRRRGSWFLYSLYIHNYGTSGWCGWIGVGVGQWSGGGKPGP